MKKLLTVLFLSVSILLSSIYLPPRMNVQANPSMVTVYIDNHFGGAAQTFDIGWHNIGSLAFGNDEISSIRVPEGFKVTIFEDDDFDGEHLTLTSDYVNMGWWDDEISSLVVERIEMNPLVTVYIDNHFNSASQSFDVGWHNIGSLAFGNDEISSIRVPAGYKVTIFEDDDFGGERLTLTQDFVNMGWWDDEISSLYVEKIALPQKYVVVHTDEWFNGGSQILIPGRYNVDQLLVGNDEISSIDSPLNTHYILYADDDFGGARGYYTEKQYQLSITDWDDRISSIEILDPDSYKDLTNYAILYQHENYGGASSMPLLPGKYNVDQLGISNDSISSIKIDDHVRVHVYDDKNFSGDNTSFYYSRPDLYGWSDRISSIEIEYVGPFNPNTMARVAEDKNGRGTSIGFFPGRYNLHDMGVSNDSISSVEVPFGYRVRLYDDENFQGECYGVYHNITNLSGKFNDKASSYIYEKIPTTNGIPIGEFNKDSVKAQLLETYAPRIYFESKEQYFPSSVEWSFQYMKREMIDGKYWITSKEELPSPTKTLPYFAGDLNSAKIYSFVAEKEDKFVDLVYYVYYPYNRGKKVSLGAVGTTFGNHLGDWEHITVRMIKIDGYVVPTQVFISAHNFGGAYELDYIEKVDGTHPVVYAARGSHGFWKYTGAHDYKEIIPEVLVLTDYCDRTTPWDTWNSMEKYYFNHKKNLNGGEWPQWLGTDFTYTKPGMDPSDPASGPIYRWGNTEDGLEAEGQRQLENAPTGPISKTTFYSFEID